MKTEYDKSLTKVDSTDATKFVLKTSHDKDTLEAEKKIKLIIEEIKKHGGLATKNELATVENKIPDASSVVKKTDLNAKTTEIEGKTPSITGLATNSALTAVENKIPDVSVLVTKTDCNTKISEIHYCSRI